ncbi:MAG: hypothetical protein ACE37F_37580 [Nannocystaceae bacterium]|nr:hypothetical protein [bacterium]
MACSLVVLSPVPTARAAAPSAESSVQAGDLSARVDATTAARQADPSPANWRAEAQAKEAAGNYDEAADAYRGELEALPEDAVDARRASEADWERMREASRGRVEDEPASTHRAEFDRQWTPPAPPEQLRPAPRPKADPTLDTVDDDRIVTKWYFWVTVAAIAASAGAVAGIAIKAARDERGDALDASALGPMPAGRLGGPGLIRF